MLAVRIAFRNIFRNTRRSLTTLSTIAIGAAAVLVFGAYITYIQYGVQTSAVQRTGHFFVIRNLPAGTYAVTSYHDENDNGKMDKNSLGVPTESYGFSNDAQGVGGPPKYSQAAFDFDGKTDKTISCSLNY